MRLLPIPIEVLFILVDVVYRKLGPFLVIGFRTLRCSLRVNVPDVPRIIQVVIGVFKGNAQLYLRKLRVGLEVAQEFLQLFFRFGDVSCDDVLVSHVFDF